MNPRSLVTRGFSRVWIFIADRNAAQSRVYHFSAAYPHMCLTFPPYASRFWAILRTNREKTFNPSLELAIEERT